MKLLMAVSSDGFLARGPEDDMKWTGRADKAMFRCLTLADPNPLLVGSATARQMPPLKDRKLVTITRTPGVENREALTTHLDLEYAAWLYPEAWVIGGPTLALAALKAGLINRAFLMVVDVVLGSGLSVKPIQELLPRTPAHTIGLDASTWATVYLPTQQWPGK